ncbi:DUF4388 domain-containing protein [Coriobacteriia bacterium Es71-Z0120]|uniref:DUF4388 domain-containing protein n=1 Tax=Parvivirga hydrogeniphila TaxID=2939460 RepID=UPI002260E9EB|nr:DUF4388 domain-containing protein [Parvivirga hydrogeniphila]MCL4079160.1 DUF4388 domain-containing protein [Parvivirga hydrogeniphila]
MALRGNLKDFSLPDVFQLVQLSKKTGVLRIKRPDAEGSIWFRDGEVFFAQSDWNREPLGQRLVNAGRITPSALAKAMEIRASEPHGGRRLGQILVDEGYITQPVLEAFVQEQIQDTIFDLMRWDEGEFNFEILPEVVDEDIGLSVSIENIVMEGSRRIEEWNRIKKKVPSMDMVFKMATAPGEGTFEISLKPTEWNLLLLTDGTRTVAELARELGKTDFEVARIIYGLFSAGLLEVASDEEVERLRTERAEREARRAARAAESAERRAAAAPVVQPVAPEAVTVGTPAAVPESAQTVAPEPVPEAPAEAEALTVPVREAAEEPEFLAAPKAAPSADDMAVFEQVMGAVLKPHPQQAPPEAPASEAASVAGEEEAASEPLPAPEVPETVEPPATAPEAPEVFVAPEAPEVFVAPEAPETPVPTAEAAPGIGPISPAELGEIPVAPVLEEAAEQPIEATEAPASSGPSFTPTGDLEKDLLALGLGELPVETEEPVAREPLGVQEAEQPAAEVEQVSTDEALSELLRSLGGEEEASTPAQAEEAPKVISTDAYLAEFETDVTLSSALTDEITALTGGGSGRARPTTTVAKLPEPGEQPAIHRDRLVDRDLVLKIIDGIEKL